MTSMAHPDAPQLTIGVDTHLEVHVAHANDQLGRPVATIQIPTTPAGYQQLLVWAHELGEPIVWGVEGTGCYGAALARFLAANAQVVVEVNRTDRQARRRQASPTPRCPGRRPSRPGRTGQGGAQGRRRPGGDDPLPASGPRHRHAGPHPDH
ncbi:MAG: transposase [Actinomycetes bacterium]